MSIASSPSRLSPTTSIQSRSTWSRLFTKQIRDEKKLWRWIICLGGGIIILVILYFVVIFPALVHLTGIANSNKYQPTVAVVKPQTPSFNAPASNTSQAELKITGFATPETTVQFIFNDTKNETAAVTTGINGEFTINFTLTEGDNTLQAYSIDVNGLESSLTKVYTVTLDQTQPTLSISEPTDGQEIVGKDKKNLTIKGTTESGAQVVVNQTRTTADSEGNFALTYALQNGDNQLAITASDRAGNQISTNLVVKFTP